MYPRKQKCKQTITRRSVQTKWKLKPLPEPVTSRYRSMKTIFYALTYFPKSNKKVRTCVFSVISIKKTSDRHFFVYESSRLCRDVKCSVAFEDLCRCLVACEFVPKLEKFVTFWTYGPCYCVGWLEFSGWRPNADDGRWRTDEKRSVLIYTSYDGLDESDAINCLGNLNSDIISGEKKRFIWIEANNFRGGDSSFTGRMSQLLRALTFFYMNDCYLFNVTR